MSIQIQCDKCQATYVVSDDKAGKTGKCRCGNDIPVPMPTSAPLPPLPPPPPQSIFFEPEPEGGFLGQGDVDSPFDEDIEGEAHIPGGMRCPKCHMISRPGAACEWCAAALAPLPPPKPAPGPVGRPGARPETARPLGQIRVIGVVVDAFKFVFQYPGLCFGSVALTLACAAALYLAAIPLMVGVIRGTRQSSVITQDPLPSRFGPPGFFRGPEPSGFGSEAPRRSPLRSGVAAAAGFGLIVVALALIPLMVGPLYVMDELLAHGRSQIGAVFKGYSSFWSILASGLVMGVVLGVLGGGTRVLAQLTMRSAGPGVGLGLGLLGQFIQIWVSIGLMFTFMEIVDRKAGAFDALGASWETADGNRFSIFLLLLLIGFGACVVVLGTAMPLAMAMGKNGPPGPVIAFEVPIAFILMTVGYAIRVILYRDLRGLEGGGK